MMNRQQLPVNVIDPGLMLRTTEIRMPVRATGHEARNEREVVA